MEGYVRVVSRKDIAEGCGKSIRVDGKDVAIFNIDGQYYAMDDICPHMGAPLGEGTLDGENVICPWHGWTFNVKTGKFTTNPDAGVDSYNLKVEGDDIFVDFKNS